MKVEVKGPRDTVQYYRIENYVNWVFETNVSQDSNIKHKTSQLLENLSFDDCLLNDNDEFPEGKEKTSLHKHKERNPKAVRSKKEWALNKFGTLKCEACDFDFYLTYGELGYGFAECHHTIRVCELTAGSKTKLSDLVIVCSNCHRMLHRSRPLISVLELKAIIDNIRNHGLS